MTETAQEWLRGYAMLALRINHQVTEANTAGLSLEYRGPAEWSEEVEREDPPPAGRLVEDAERLLDDPPFDPRRAAFLAAQVRALRAVARRLDGEELPLREYVRHCLGLDPEWVPESVFEEAHAELDAALPRTAGSPADRMHAWEAAHTLAPDRMGQLPGLVDRAMTETRARTNALVPLPVDEVVDCELVAGVQYRAVGDYHGGLRSTILINSDLPFNLADLLYVVAHEGHPGHIAEAMLKEIHLADKHGRIEQQVQFLLSPQFVISEGLGLHADIIIFPGDQAQAWLADNILAEQDIRPDGSDFAAIHRAKNMLWGVWANASFLAADGRPDDEVTGYLSRWALLTETEADRALGVLRVPGGNPYIFCYYNGWRLVRDWLDVPDRTDRVRRLLTEQLLPADLHDGDESREFVRSV